MAKYSNTVEYNIKTTLDNTGIAKLQAELTQLQNQLNIKGAKGLLDQGTVNKTIQDINKIRTALNEAFNPKLGMLNTSKFMNSLKSQGASLNSIYQSFSKAGASGERAFMSMYGQISKIDMGMKSISKTTDKIMNTLGNTVRWGLIASGFAAIMNSVHQAAQYTKELDESLTNIMMVSGISRDNMNEYARAANQVAQALGSTTVAMTNATQVFVQQGYDLPTSQRLAEYSTILGNVSQQDTATASDEITAYMNAFKIPLDQIGNALSKWAEVANVSAADVEELSVASQKAASVAATVGVDMDQLAATIATIETVTREAPENIGNGLKTIYSRLSDIKLGKTLEDGVNLGQITKQLDKVGVQVLDQQGKMRDVGLIVEDLMAKWQTMDKTEKAATATTLAGRFQLARFEALMNRSDLYQSYLESSRSQTGTETLDFMQETFEDSLQGRLNTVQAKIEEIFLNLFETDSFYGAVDAIGGLVDVLNELIKATGGGETALLGIVVALTQLSSNTLSRGISNFIQNRETESLRQQNFKQQKEMAQAQLAGKGLNTGNANFDRMANDIANVQMNSDILNEEQQRNFNTIIDQRVEAINKLSVATEKQSNAEQVLRVAFQEMEADIGTKGLPTLEALASEFMTMSEEEILASESFAKFRGEITTTTQHFNKFIDRLKEGKTAPIALQEEAKKLSTELKQLQQSGVLTEEQTQKLKETLELLRPAVMGDKKAIEQLNSQTLTKMAEALQLDDEQLSKLLKTLGVATKEVSVFGAAVKASEGQTGQFLHGIELQTEINKIVGLVQGIGQLAFAWQSFQHLGSLWADEDIDLGEKILQTIINISFALPMLLTGFSEIAKGFGAIKNLIQSGTVQQIILNGLLGIENGLLGLNTQLRTERLKKIVQEAAVTGDLNAVSRMWSILLNIENAELAGLNKQLPGAAGGMLLLESGETAAAGGAATLGTALAGINVQLLALMKNPVFWIGAAVVGIIMGIAAGIGAIAKAEEQRKKTLQEQIDASNATVQTIKDNKENLNKLYNEYKTTKVVSDEFKQALLDQADALGITNAKVLIAAGQYEVLKDKIDAAIQSELELNDILLKQQIKDDTKDFNAEDTNMVLQQKAGIEHGKSTDAYTRIIAYEKQILELRKEQAEIDKQIRQAEKLGQKDQVTQLKARKAALQEEIEYYAGLTTSDAGKRIKENGQQLIENKVLQAEYDPRLQYRSGQSIEEYEQQIWETGEFDSMEIVHEFVKAYVSGSSKAAKDAATQQYYEDSKQIAYDKAYEITSANDETGLYGSKRVFGYDDIGEYYANQIVGTIDDLPIPEEDKANLFNWIDWNGTQDEIQAQLDMIIANYQSENPLTADQFLAKNKAEGMTLEEQIANLDTTNLDKNVDADQYKDLTQFIAESGSELEGFSDDLLDNADASAEAAKEILRFDSALERAAKNMEDWQRMLRSDVAEDNAKAASELKDVYADILDLADKNDISTAFAADPENLDLLQRVMEGDIEAYDELADRAQKDIEIKAGIDTAQAEADVAKVNELLDSGNFDDIEIGAAVNIDGLEDTLNGIIEASGMTAQEAESLLASMGLEAELEPVSEPVQTQQEYSDVMTTLVPKTAPVRLPAAGDAMGGFSGGNIETADVITTIKRHTVPTEQIYSAAGLRVTGTSTGKTSGGGVRIKSGSIKKAASGAAKYRNASSGAGGSSKGGSGGGGGGGSKAKQIAMPKKSQIEADPYNKVNATLEKLADEYTKVDKAKDRMYGDRYKRAAEEEIKNLQKQNEQLEKRVDISQKIREALKTGQDNPEYGIYLNDESLAKYGLLDEDTNDIIDNYPEKVKEAAQAAQAQWDAMQAYIDAHGGEVEDDTEFKEMEEQYNNLAANAKNILEVVNQYQEASDKIRDDTQQIQDNMYEIEDKIIDIWNYAKDAAKELGEFREDQIDLAETLATLWGDDAVKSLGFAFDRFTNMFEANEKSLADSIVDYQNRLNKATDENMIKWYQDQLLLAQQAMNNGTSVLDLNMQRINDIYKAIDQWKENGISELFGSNEKAMWEAFDEAWKDAVDYAKKLKGYIQDIHDNIGQVMDDMYDAMDRRNDLFDQIDNQYEYLKDMTELVHGEKAYDMLEKVTRKQAQAGEERLKTLEEERKANHDMLEGLEEGSEEYLKALEKEQELDKDILDVRKNIAETYKKAKELANELAVQNWLDNFTADINGVEVPLEYAADQWERIKENADNYLDDLNRAWELEKLENEYLKLVDDAVDPNIQKQITKQMQEQLGYLREKDKLSEYDVKYANAQLEILQKTIALEDARANKNQMKLRRDSQGNYSYVYAANRNDVRDKENDLLDARMNGYNMSVEASRNATDDYFNHIQNMADKLRSVANDASLSAEQVDAITQDIIDKGYEYLNAKGEQLTTAQRNGIESYIQAAKELSELNAGNVLDMSRKLEEGLVDDLGMVTDTFHTAVKDWVDGETGLAYFREAADQTGRDLVRNVEDFVIAVGEANTNIEAPLNDIETGFIDTNGALVNLMASAQDFYGFLEEKSGVIGQAAADLAEYKAALTDMNSKMNEYYDAWEQRGKELESEKAINSQLRIEMNNLQEEYETKLAEAQRRAGGGSGGSGSSGSTDTSNGSVVGYSGRYYSDSWGNGPSGNWFADQPGAVRISSFSRRSGYGDYNVHLETLNGGHLGWVKESQLFDTGGYTGAWGPGGKAAILHEKELVLNAQDTQNMLAAVSVVRGLVEMLKSSTFNLNDVSQRGLSSTGFGNNIEQRVEITAEFPGVRSASDIEQALLNLSNKAYQYAYNKNEKFM